MIASLNCVAKSSMRCFLVLALALLTPVELQAAQLKVEIKLIWGTNDKKLPEPKPKRADEVTAEKLRKVFKWTNYFEINRVTGTIASRGTNRFVMSKDCTIEIAELAGPQVAVTLIGKGSPVVAATHHLTKGETINLASECKDGNAWFVLLTELDEK